MTMYKQPPVINKFNDSADSIRKQNDNFYTDLLLSLSDESSADKKRLREFARVDPSVRDSWKISEFKLKRLTPDIDYSDVVVLNEEKKELAYYQEKERDCTIDYSSMLFVNPQDNQYSRYRCKCWGCKNCYPRVRKNLKRKMIKVADHFGLNRMISLSCAWPEFISKDDSFDVMSRNVNHFMKDLRDWTIKKYGVNAKRNGSKRVVIFQIRERHCGGGENDGYAHAHILANQFIPHKVLNAIWHNVTKDKRSHCNVTQIRQATAAHYLSKYLTKESAALPKGSRHYSASFEVYDFLKTEKQHKVTGWQLQIWDGKVYRLVERYDFAFNWSRLLKGTDSPPEFI